MTYKGNIGTLLDSIYVRNKIPTKQKEVHEARKLRKQKLAKKNLSEQQVPVIKVVEKIVVPVVSNEDILYNKLLQIRTIYKDEIKVHGEQTVISEGFVYIITNNAWPGWIKAGMAFDYEKRLVVYNQCDPLKSYKIEGLRWTSDRRLSENVILKELQVSAVSSRGEWFKIDTDIALDIFYRAIL